VNKNIFAAFSLHIKNKQKMPNLCYNVLYLTHDDPEMIKKAIKAYKKSKLLFEFIPYEGEWDYDWCIKHWGTKWDIILGCSKHMKQISPMEVKLPFRTAWSPPIDVYHELLKQGFGIRAYWSEAGMACCGRMIGDEDVFYSKKGLDKSTKYLDIIPDDILNEIGKRDVRHY